MSLIKPVTKLDTYYEYLSAIDTVPSYQIDKCFACGLPAVALYMKAIGLEAEYFDIINKLKNKSILFRDLFYLLILTNSNNKFFTKVPEGLLEIKIPQEILDAQLEVTQPDFQMAFTFNAEQLKEILQLITATPDQMIRVGTKQKAVGLMFSDNKFYMYHSERSEPLVYTTLAGCIDQLLRTLGAEQKIPALYIDRYGLKGAAAVKAHAADNLFKKFCNSASAEQLQDTLYISVQAGLTDQVKYLHEIGVPFDKVYKGNINVLMLAVCAKNVDMIKLLTSFKDVDRNLAITEAVSQKNRELMDLLRVGEYKAPLLTSRFGKSNKTPPRGA
jgi:hypothetical protein